MFTRKRHFLCFLLINQMVYGLPCKQRSARECSVFNFEESKDFLANFIFPGNLVFDVGAHVGKKAQLYLALGARVICIEPQPDCVRQLKEKFRKNPKVVIEPIGLSNMQGMLELFECSNSSTISTFSVPYTKKGRFADHDFKWDMQLMVPVTTLDALIQKYGIPHFCKIDVENFEYEVLQGLNVPIPCISFESNTEWIENTQKCIVHLKKLGYKKFNFAPGESSWFMFPDWLDPDIFFDKLLIASSDKDWNDSWGLWGDVYAVL